MANKKKIEKKNKKMACLSFALVNWGHLKKLLLPDLKYLLWYVVLIPNVTHFVQKVFIVTN